MLTDAAMPIGPMQASKLKTLSLVLTVVLLNSVGNVFLAWGMRHISTTVAGNPLDYIRAMLNPFVASGIVLLILWMLTRMALLQVAPLSFAVPASASTFVLETALAKLVLKERVGKRRTAGALLVLSGVLLLAR